MERLGFTVVYICGGLILLFSGISLFAGYTANTMGGVSSVHCDHDNQQVYVAVDGEVIVMDEDGTTQLVLQAPEGEVKLKSVYDVDRALDGGYLVSESGTRHRVSYYNQQGEFQETFVEGEELAKLYFEIVPVAEDKIIVADNVRHELKLVNKKGQVLKTKKCPYPNGLLRWSNDTYAAICTAISKVIAFDGNLDDVSPPKDSALAVAMEMNLRGRGSIMHMSKGQDGSLLLNRCLNHKSTCRIFRLAAGSQNTSMITHLEKAQLPTNEWSQDLYEISGVCATSQGSVLVASDWYSTLLAFTHPEGQALEQYPDDAAVLDDELLASGGMLGTNLNVKVFGDLAFQEKLSDLWGKRSRMYGLNGTAKTGNYIILTLLLIAIVLAKLFFNSSIEELNKRFTLIVDDLVKPDVQNLVRYFKVTILLAGIGAFLGYLVAGLGGAIVGALLAAKTIGKKWSIPALFKARGTEIAQTSFDIFLGAKSGKFNILKPEEKLLSCSFALEATRFDKEVFKQHFREESVNLPDDPFDILELLSPHFNMVVVTNQRIIRYACGLLGKPQGIIWSHPYVTSQEQATTRDGMAFVDRNGLMSIIPTAGFEGAGYKYLDPKLCALFKNAVRLGGAEALCSECLFSLSRKRICSHYQKNRSLAWLLGIFAPGAGHLMIGDLRRGRLFLVVLVTLFMNFLGFYLFYTLGTFPVYPLMLIASATSLISFWVFAIADLGRHLKELDVSEQLVAVRS
jgi:hypothetical protein